jgi:hypothetical protein
MIQCSHRYTSNRKKKKKEKTKSLEKTNAAESRRKCQRN